MTTDDPYGPAWAELKFTRSERDQLAQRVTELLAENDQLRAENDQLRATAEAATGLLAPLRDRNKRLQTELDKARGMHDGLLTEIVRQEVEMGRLRVVVDAARHHRDRRRDRSQTGDWRDMADDLAVLDDQLHVAIDAIDADISPVIGAGEGASCCGASIYWCPVAGEFECPTHGGFAVCCDNPEAHVPVSPVIGGGDGEVVVDLSEANCGRVLRVWKRTPNGRMLMFSHAPHIDGPLQVARLGRAVLEAVGLIEADLDVGGRIECAGCGFLMAGPPGSFARHHLDGDAYTVSCDPHAEPDGGVEDEPILTPDQRRRFEAAAERGLRVNREAFRRRLGDVMLATLRKYQAEQPVGPTEVDVLVDAVLNVMGQPADGEGPGPSTPKTKCDYRDADVLGAEATADYCYTHQSFDCPNPIA